MINVIAIFDLDDGGRHHPYKNLREIEEKLFNEAVKRIKRRECTLSN